MADIIHAGVKIDSAEGVQNLNRATQAFDKAEASAKKFNNTMGQSNKAFSGLKNLFGAFIGFQTISRAYHDFTTATTQAEQADARLGATLKATGFAAGFTARQIDEMSQSLAQSTLFDDETIKNGAAVLATFRNVSGDTFKDAIRLSADLSAVMGTDLQGSIVQVGKALNDPIQGVTALRRVGVSFSENQQQMIRNFVKTNDLASAQRIVLQELAAEFGGAAEAANTGLSGAIAAAKKNYDNFLESLGRTQQVGGPIQAVFRAIADFWKSRELTTDPLEDLAIALDDAQTKAEGMRGALRGLMEGTADWREVINQFPELDIPLIGGGEEAVRAQLVERIQLTNLQIGTIQSQIETEKALRKTQDDSAKAGSQRAQLEAENERRAEERRARREKERQAQEDRVKAINDEVAALQVQAATLGMTEREATLYVLRLKGATDANLQAADAALKAIAAFEAQQEEMARQKKEREKEEERLRKQSEEESKAYEVMWEQALRNTQDVFADFFEELFTTATFRTDQILKQLWRMWMRFLAQLAAHALFRFVFKIATGGFGFPGGGTFGVDAGAAIPADVAHEGGTVGNIRNVRTVDPRAFIGAPRYHTGGVAGLKPDEVPIIAQKGERIVPRGGASRGTVQINFPGGKVFDPSNPEHRRDFIVMIRRVFELHEIDVEVLG